MQSSVTTWDLRTMPHESTLAEKMLVFFFLILGIAAITKLIQSWWSAPPYLASRQAGNQSFARKLQDSARTLSDWIKLTLLFDPLLIAFDLYQECSGLLAVRRVVAADVVYLLQQMSFLAEMGLLLALLLFSIRWHFLNRLEFLKKYLPPSQTEPA